LTTKDATVALNVLEGTVFAPQFVLICHS